VSVVDAQAALADGRFGAALDALGAAPAGDDDPAQWYELRAQAAYGAGAFDDAIGAWEQLHSHHRARHEQVPAARAAAMTAMFLLIDSGLMSAVRGWLRRAERMLYGGPTTPVHALVAAVRTYERFMCGDMAGAAEQAATAIELGERFDVVPAVVIGRTATGRIAVLHGDVEGGLDQLDEVAALLMSGDVDALTTGMMYCELICAAQGLARPDRAREWTDAMERWCPERAFGGLRGRCRVHRAELLRISGPGEAAEREALQACAELRPWMRREFGWPLVELGSARLWRGDLAGAEEAFVAANDHGWPPHPGLALVRLEQGDVACAAELIAMAIAHPVDAPSKEMPPFGDLRLAPLLDAQAEIAAAAGDRPTVAATAERLGQIAARYASPALLGAADLAAARAALLDGDATTAVARARRAVAEFVGLDAVFDVGRAREVLAAAHAAAGEAHAARLELDAARRAYTAYGAEHRVARVTGAPAGGSAPAAPPSPAARRGTLRADGQMWLVQLDDVAVHVKDLKGLRYLRRLIAEPGREFHVLDLVAVERGTLRAGTPTTDGSLGTRREEEGLPVLDRVAIDAYRRRLAEVDEDIDDATERNDLGRLAKAQADREYVIGELTSATGLGGRLRTTGGSAERARTSVARSLRYALAELAACHPDVAEHLRTSVRTGTYCSYQPDPFARVDWTV
jgi:hypothetical protein